MNCKPKMVVKFTVRLELDEIEARALEAVACYGDDAFLKTFYKHMGKHYLSPHENGVRSLFKSINRQISPALRATNEARESIIKAR